MSTFLVIFFAFALMVALPTILVFALKNHQKALKITAIVFACIYFVCVFIGTTCTLDIDWNYTSIGFDFNEPWFSLDFISFEFKPGNIFINLFMFFPLGFIVYAFTQNKPFAKTILFALAASLIVELYQFILPIYRNTELTDIALNTLSGVLSATYCKILLHFEAFKPTIKTKINNQKTPE